MIEVLLVASPKSPSPLLPLHHSSLFTMEKLTPKQKADLKELFKLCPELRKKSEADRKKYGEKRLIRMNQELMRKIEKEAEKRKERMKINEDEVRKVLMEEGKPILKGRYSVFIEKEPPKK